MNRNLPYELAYNARKVFPPLIILITFFITVTSSHPFYTIVLLLLAPAIGILTFRLSRKHDWYHFNYVWILNGIILYLLIILCGKESPAWIMSIPFITAILMLVERKLQQLVILLIFLGGLCFINYYTGRTITENLTIAGALILVTALIERSHHYLKLQTQLIEQQKKGIEQKQNEILDSIKYAEKLQKAILPPENLIKKYLPDSFVFFKPKDIVSGDFYWLESRGGKVYFSVADCTGHGVPGSMVSIMCSQALTKTVRELNLKHPFEILNKTVDILEDHFSKSEEEVKDGMDLALCSLDMDSNTLEYSGAKNSLYMVRDDELMEFKADRQPVGRYVTKASFNNQKITVQKGDCLYMLSDGFPDQFGGADGKKFKYKQIKELILRVSDKPMVEQGIEVEKAFKSWLGDLEQIDDVCIMGVRITF